MKIVNKHLLIILPLVLFYCSAISQARLPNMYVDSRISRQRINNFSRGKDSKYNRLKNLNAHQDLNLIYSKEAMDTLISRIGDEDGLILYFARYDKNSSTNMPAATKEDKLILLFSPGKEHFVSANEKFYFINDKNPKSPVIEINDNAAAHRWITNFITYCQPELKKDLDLTDDRNYDDRRQGYFDTESIFYSKENLTEAITEEEKQDHILAGSPVYISAYQFSFSSYDKNGNLAEDNTYHYKNRMQVEINYMYKNVTNTVFVLDELDYFIDRVRATLREKIKDQSSVLYNKYSENDIAQFSAEQLLKLLLTLDNGHLCPTDCPN